MTLGWERQEAYVGAAPSGVLDGRALVVAAGAACALPQDIARRVAAPADDGDRARQRRVVLAPLAVEPQPRRRAVQVSGRNGCHDGRSHQGPLRDRAGVARDAGARSATPATSCAARWVAGPARRRSQGQVEAEDSARGFSFIRGHMIDMAKHKPISKEVLCNVCNDTGWVCEEHADRAWERTGNAVPSVQ